MSTQATATPPQGTDGDPGRPAVERAASGKDLDEEQERSALDWLLGAPEPARYKITVQYETPVGMVDLVFHFKALDSRAIDKIETRHIDKDTGMMNKTEADYELVAAATEAIEDPKAGTKVTPKSEAFRTVEKDQTPVGSPVLALQARFGTQGGLIAGVARGIREVGGWSGDRVGKAQRQLVAAAGN